MKIISLIDWHAENIWKRGITWLRAISSSKDTAIIDFRRKTRWRRKNKMASEMAPNGPHGTIFRNGNIKIRILETLRVTKIWGKQIYLSGGRGPSFLPYYKLLTRLNLFISKYQICSFQLKLAQFDTLYNHLARKLSKWQFISQQAQINHCMLLYGNYVIDYSEWWRWSNAGSMLYQFGNWIMFSQQTGLWSLFMQQTHVLFNAGLMLVYLHDVVPVLKQHLQQSGLWNLKGLNQAKSIKNRWFYFCFLIWPYMMYTCP